MITDPADIPAPTRKGVWPDDPTSTKVDLANGVIASSVDVTTLDRYALSEAAIAIVLNGQMVRGAKHVSALYVMGMEGAASVACALIAGLGRAQGITQEMAFAQVADLFAALRAQGKDL